MADTTSHPSQTVKRAAATAIPHIIPTPTVARRETQATRQPTSHPATHPAVWQPWTALEAQAAARYKTEITAALAALERANSTAGQLLDTSYTAASEAAAALEAAAYASWHKYMAAADNTRNAMLEAAVAAYDQAITYATGQYGKALSDAEHTYSTLIKDAQRAQNDAKGIVA